MKKPLSVWIKAVALNTSTDYEPDCGNNYTNQP